MHIFIMIVSHPVRDLGGATVRERKSRTLRSDWMEIR